MINNQIKYIRVYYYNILIFVLVILIYVLKQFVLRVIIKKDKDSFVMWLKKLNYSPKPPLLNKFPYLYNIFLIRLCIILRRI